MVVFWAFVKITKFPNIIEVKRIGTPALRTNGKSKGRSFYKSSSVRVFFLTQLTFEFIDSLNCPVNLLTLQLSFLCLEVLIYRFRSCVQKIHWRIDNCNCYFQFLCRFHHPYKGSWRRHSLNQKITIENILCCCSH